MFSNFFFENRAGKEIMWKTTVELDRPQMTIWHTRIACGICKATNTHSQYVTNIAFPLQQCSNKRASMLHYTYVACLVHMERWNWKAWLTVGMSHVMLPAMLRVSKYMWLVFIYFLKCISSSYYQFFVNAPYQETIVAIKV
jgi:hypothetical protein